MINYKHLQYFWRVAKAGGVGRASEQIHVTPQTISEQIHDLEASLGVSLFERKGRKLALTEAGQQAFDYAERIFALGSEAEAVLRGSGSGQILHFRVGVADVVAKPIAYRLLEPAIQVGKVHLTAREWKLEGLIAELAIHRLDMVIADSPTPPGISVRAFNHRLGETGMSFFSAPERFEPGEPLAFPACLHAQPFLMPGEDTALHGRLARWFERHGVTPDLVAEFDDSALMTAFGRSGHGVFAAPSVLAQEIVHQYGVIEIGSTDEVRQEFFAISIQRRNTHPCVRAIFDHAAESLPLRIERARSALSRAHRAR